MGNKQVINLGDYVLVTFMKGHPELLGTVRCIHQYGEFVKYDIELRLSQASDGSYEHTRIYNVEQHYVYRA